MEDKLAHILIDCSYSLAAGTDIFYKLLSCMSPDLGKPYVMGFFLKIEFDAWLISSTIELNHIQVLGRTRASLWRYSALFTIVPHPQ